MFLFQYHAWSTRNCAGAGICVVYSNYAYTRSVIYIIHMIIHLVNFICGHVLLLFSPDLGNVWFSLGGTTYHNNSLVTLEDIGEGDAALLCVTDNTSCCRPPYTQNLSQSAIGNWYFPNGTRVPSSGAQWDLHRTRGNMVVLLHRRRGGEDGVFHCVVPDKEGNEQTTYIGVYTGSVGKCMTMKMLVYAL